MSANAAIFNPTESTSAATGDGFSCPRLTTTGRLAISFGVNDKGMMVFDTTLNNLFIWNGTAWESVPGSGDSSDTQVIFNDNGNLAGDPGLLYQKSLQRLTVGTNVDIWRGVLNDGTSTAVGRQTLELTAAGAVDNTAIGYRAMYRALTAAGNTAVGVNALSANFMTGSNNVAVGFASGDKVSSGGGNAFFGTGAGSGVNTGSNNVAAGLNALAASGVFHTGSNNIAIGLQSLFSSQAISGSDNIGIGQNTLRALSTGNRNVAVGQGNLFTLTTGTENVAIGYLALAAATGVNLAVAIGQSAGRSVSTSTGIIAIGNNALGNNTTVATGNYNIAIGDASMFSSANVVGSDNVGIGRDSFRTLSSGTNNVAIGNAALYSLSTGSNNISIGQNSLLNLGAGSGNVAIGIGASNANTSNDNVAIGINALALNTSGTGQTAVGRQALNAATGSNNTAFGSNAGANITSGTSNICIGVSSDTSSATVSNELVIGSSAQFVATNGAAATYFATATAGAVVPGNCQGFIRIRLNGSFVKIPVYGN